MKVIRPHHLFDAVVWTVGVMFLVVLAVHEAHAGEHVYDNRNATYRAECGSCHVPYPPALLSSSSWKSILGTLEHHYGTDAAVGAASLRSLREYVAASANQRSAEPTARGDGLPRITTSRWFVQEHRKVAARWSDPKVKSAANCSACHANASQGDFSEAALRSPR